MRLFEEHAPKGVIAITRTPANWATDWEPVYECESCGALVRREKLEDHEGFHDKLDAMSRRTTLDGRGLDA